MIIYHCSQVLILSLAIQVCSEGKVSFRIGTGNIASCEGQSLLRKPPVLFSTDVYSYASPYQVSCSVKRVQE